jgi:hypothetical protein
MLSTFVLIIEFLPLEVMAQSMFGIGEKIQDNR